jgi:hypothetical protein
MATRKYQVIDTHHADKVVAEFPTHRRALNHTRKLEPHEGAYRTNESSRCHGWRYLIRPVNTTAA